MTRNIPVIPSRGISAEVRQDWKSLSDSNSQWKRYDSNIMNKLGGLNIHYFSMTDSEDYFWTWIGSHSNESALISLLHVQMCSNTRQAWLNEGAHCENITVCVV